VLYRGQKDALAEFLPLDAQNWIVSGNSLRLDWLSICPSTGTGVKVVADDLFGTPLNQTEIEFKMKVVKRIFVEIHHTLAPLGKRTNKRPT
jgi:hypothetical protein